MTDTAAQLARILAAAEPLRAVRAPDGTSLVRLAQRGLLTNEDLRWVGLACALIAETLAPPPPPTTPAWRDVDDQMRALLDPRLEPPPGWWDDALAPRIAPEPYAAPSRPGPLAVPPRAEEDRLPRRRNPLIGCYELDNTWIHGRPHSCPRWVRGWKS